MTESSRPQNELSLSPSLSGLRPEERRNPFSKCTGQNSKRLRKTVESKRSFKQRGEIALHFLMVLRNDDISLSLSLTLTSEDYGPFVCVGEAVSGPSRDEFGLGGAGLKFGPTRFFALCLHRHPATEHAVLLCAVMCNVTCGSRGADESELDVRPEGGVRRAEEDEAQFPAIMHACLREAKRDDQMTHNRPEQTHTCTHITQ